MLRMMLFVLLGLIPLRVDAHWVQTEPQWKYDYECCGGRDCKEMPASNFKAEKHGWYVKHTGEIIPYDSDKIKPSKDRNFHWCKDPYDYKGLTTRCLYVPGGMT